MRRSRLGALALLPVLPFLACSAGPSASAEKGTFDPFLEDLQRRTFDFFWETTNPANGLVPDRWPTPSFSSIAAVGFGLTAYTVGVERGYISREQARERTLATLRFFWTAPQAADATGVSGYRGFFYHFLDMETGHRFQTTELSSIDTALLILGVLSAQSYFDGADPAEAEIRALADSLYRRVEWNWMQPRAPLIAMAWRPERGLGAHDYEGYNEAMFLYVLALGSPAHPIDDSAWQVFTSTYEWADLYGQEHVNFAPLFGHQYSHVWIDFRGIQDAYMRERGIDYFENSRRATLGQRAYAIANPMGWKGYGEDGWGWTASDGPMAATLVVNGEERTFRRYWARGVAVGDVRDDGTLVPTAAGGSIPFAPEVTIPLLQALHDRYGEHLYQRYGFLDSFNPTLGDVEFTPERGTRVPGVGWFNPDYLGIDQGPIVLMIENYRNGFVWELMKRNPYIVRGLCRAGFTGGWLAGRCG